ncbi:A disintegrin and metalloproteinase with thrombospondin motifs 9 isoform X2 [Diabrotica virgifera virgifera]|uniref:A disintegrin and metalloproteinase with thrombospondin motifs 9 n=2 Tax=Diabrotica virgifera virgifera TaxID=50390 RepID=A0ABM5KN64_DIAVI|nr:A disintegrin and metalloproteinase with thrombospondin motifs 9 isoform X2 [Diabrotica virgifera virgifera]
MTKRFLKKQVLASCAILVLGAIIIFVWVEFSQGAFREKTESASVVNFTSTMSFHNSEIQSTTKHKEFIEKTHLEDFETDDVEFVKPLKISNPADGSPNSKQESGTNSGHFRPKQAESWDLHPVYEIKAFDKTLFLELHHHNKFMSPNLHIATHFKNNFTQRTRHDPRISGCIYEGHIRGDKSSYVAVSLCSGMTGVIKATDHSYYIEPAEEYVEGSTTSLIHRMKRLPHPTRKMNDVNSDIMEFNENDENKTIIEDDFYQETEYIAKDHRIRRRSLSSYEPDSEIEIEGTCDMLKETIWRSPADVLKDAARPRRNAEWNSIYRMSNESYVKVLVVADGSMLKYHTNSNELTVYILTLMSHVSFLFKEETVGNPISISVVDIDILNTNDFSNSNSSGMLLKFCDWTKRHAKDRIHNVAVLLTRDTICRNESAPQHCTTLGVAELNSMCQSGCAIVKDKGLATSYTIAHEIGHILSMPHDEDKKCERFNKHISITNIMSKSFKKDTKPFTWSPCSRYFITEFLDSERSTCLRRPPVNNYLPTYHYTDTLPGDKFDLDTQCELEFGPGRKVCLSGVPSAPCEHLYCSANNTEYACTSTFSPWADGTRCGDSKVCFNGECRYEYELVPVNGGWGPWKEYGPCSRTCGGGVRASQRYCNSPKPLNGGQYCIGENVRYESCNIQDCDINSLEFRAFQCQEFNNKSDDIINSSVPIYWFPDYNIELHEDQCRLFCIPNKVKPSYRLQDKVQDGTKCGPSGFGICVNGICKPGGCDNVLDSTVDLDDCGICGGDNSRCQEISGAYNKPAETIGYNRVVRIPKGSSNVNITQDSYPYVDDNYLVLLDGETGESLLNGNFMANRDSVDIIFANIKLKYSGSNTSVEWINSETNKKLPKDLVVKVLSMQSLSPPNIHYRYVIDVKEAPSYGWQLTQNQVWTKCDSICEGKQYRIPICIDLTTQAEVPKTFCDNMDDSQIQTKECNTHCQLSWNIASKSACSPQCGKGIRHIYYNCLKMYKKKSGYSENVNDRHCTKLGSPPAMENCNTICNSTRWHYSQWSECSKTCGGGLQKRTAKCVDDRYTPIDDSYCNNSEKIIEQICNTENCPVWTLADQSPCSAPCGGGYKNLTYYCVLDGRIHDNHDCDVSMRPPDTERCNEQACGRWAPLNDYHSCSVTCGEGIERRQFVCMKFDSTERLNEEYCRELVIPTETRPCYRPKCEIISLYKRRNSVTNTNAIIPEPFHMYNTYKWVPENWSTCSETCGEGGRRKQQFRCLNDAGQENYHMCERSLKPNVFAACNQFACPRWVTGDWSPNCDANCERYRAVRCADHSGKAVADSQCDSSRKPEHLTKCRLSECPYITNSVSRRYFDSSEKGEKRYRWKMGPWKPCSNKCGKGNRRRHIECEDSLNEITVVDTLCRHLKKPRATRPCERYSCKFAWTEGYWSACSASCGTGVKKRNVTCHRVYKGGAIDPIPLPDLYQNKIHHQNYCSVYNKPPVTAKCILSQCGDQYIWRPGPWKQCSHACGRRGRQVRAIPCVNVWTHQRVPRSYCRANLKPPRKRKCNQWRCLYKSCKELKHATGTKENKDYIISVLGRPVNIHCYKMDTPEPLEYISLHPDSMNFAELYDKRLTDVRSCPNGGQRDDSCQCDNLGPERSGATKFWKVRLNITSLRIINDDFTFSKQLRGRRVPYGTAGDCYSSSTNCPQGRFEVDLTHTSFRLVSSVRWEKVGPYASAEIRRSDTTASGQCGGYCGQCVPDPSIGLAVEIT